MKNKILPTVTLSAICLVVALLLAVINIFTAPVISEALERKQAEALFEILGEDPNTATPPKQIEDLSAYSLPSEITAVYYRESDGVYVFRMTVSGKSSGMIIICAIDGEGKVIGTKCIDDQETPGYSAPVFEKTENGQAYKDMTLGGFGEILVSGSTLTSKGYARAVKAALEAREIMTGGTGNE